MKKFLSLLLILVILFSLIACKKNPKKFTDYSFDYFNTVTTIIGFEESKEVFDKNCEKIKNLLNEYHKLYDIYTLYDGVNNLCKLNQTVNGQHQALKVDKKIIDLLLFAKEMHQKTNGKINVAMGSVLSIWHQYRTNGIDDPNNALLPPAQILQDALPYIDISNLLINTTDNTVAIKEPKTLLDVGGIAKGYAVEQIAKQMKKSGMNGYILNVGGNVRIVGNRPDKEKWKVGIENPNPNDTENPYIEYLSLSEMSLVTSGSYQRFYTVNGKNYHHIIDPNTLYPAEYFTSVSVLCKDSGLADALSTALFCLDLKEGKQLLKSFPEVEVMWVLKDNTTEYTNGFKNYCN